MARKNRNLASFDELANSNINKNSNTNDDVKINENKNDNVNNDTYKDANASVNKDDDANMNINVNNDVNDNINIKELNEGSQQSAAAKETDYLDKLIEGHVKKSDTSTVLTGIYLQKDLLKVLDSLAKKGGRGAKSKIVNEALRSVFIDKGLL